MFLIFSVESACNELENGAEHGTAKLTHGILALRLMAFPPDYWQTGGGGVLNVSTRG